MRRTVLAFLLQAAFLSGAGAQTIGLAMPRTDDTFRGTIAQGVRKATAEAGLQLDVSDAQNDSKLQIENVKRQIKDGVSALIVLGLDSDAEVEIRAAAGEARIPLVFVNHEPHHDLLGDRTVYVGSEERVAGTLQGQEVCRVLGGKGTAVVMIGELTHPAAKARTRYVREVLSTPECSGIEIQEEQSANWDTGEGEALMQLFLEGGLKPDAVISNNDAMALGAVNALKKAKQKAFVIGVDAIDPALDSLVKKELDATVLQDGPAQGALAVDLTRRMMAGETVDRLNWIPFKLVLPADAPALIAQRAGH